MAADHAREQGEQQESAEGPKHALITGLDPAAGEQAAAAIRRESGQELVTFLQADHATVAGNQQLADQVRAAVPGLDVLVNNVGGLYQSRWETATGMRPPWP